MIGFVASEDEKRAVAAEILGGLPEWFGLPDSTNQYIADCGKMPFWASYDGRGRPNGFIALKENSPFTCEIYVMGVLKAEQHRGIGRELWNAFRDYAREKGYEYVQVKTVQSGRYEEYDATNCFYQHIGFRALEVFSTLWDAWNPCQIYILYIGR